MKYGLTEDEIGLIKSVFEKAPEVETVFIYGSRAKNTFKRTSDIDFAVKLINGNRFIIASLKDDLDELPIIYEIDLTDEKTMDAGDFKEEYERTKRVFYLKGWRMVRLGDVAEKITKGTTPKSFSINNNDVNYIKSESLSYDGVIDESKFAKITNKTNNELQRSKLKENDILLSMAGIFLGKTGLVKKSMLPANTNQAVAILTVNLNVDYKFLWFKLRDNESVNYFNSTYSQSAQPNINFEEIKSLPILLPQITEQRSIAAVLSSFDDKIELLREQNKTLESIAQAIFKEWFVKFNFPGASGWLIDSQLGKIPVGWRVGKLGDEFNVIMGQSPEGKSYNQQDDGYIFFQARAEYGERFPIVRLYTTEPNRMAEKFDVLVSVRAPVGDINVAFEKCCIGRGLAAVRSKYKSYMLYKIMSLKEVFDKFESEGTVFGSINKDSFLKIEVVIPEKKIIEQFEMIAKQIDYKIFNNYSQIQTLTSIRNALLSKLMKGEIRVKMSEP
jgi:type I restriction enzyme S subunit